MKLNSRIPPILLTLCLGTGGHALSQGITELSSSGGSLALAGGRFQITAEWQTATGSGSAQPVPLTLDTGYFWFFDPTNVEVLVKVLDGCAASQHEWVFAGGLTDVGVSMTVTDTQTGASKTYTNANGTPFLPIQDTETFRCSTEPEPGPLTGEWTGTFDTADHIDCSLNVPASATFEQRGSAVEGYVSADASGCGALRAHFEGTLQGDVLYGTVVGGVARYRFNAGSTAHGTLSWDMLDLTLKENGGNLFPVPGGTLHLHRR